MNIYTYEGIAEREISEPRYTAKGQLYTLQHPPELIVSMPFKGTNQPNANAQGWERNSEKYFRGMLKDHPEFFSKKNTALIMNGRVPIVDNKFLEHFPHFKPYTNEKLHHHIGENGLCTAWPESAHNGRGEIHNVERDLGIRANAEKFSARCAKMCEVDPLLLGQTSNEFVEHMIQTEKIHSPTPHHKKTDTFEPEAGGKLSPPVTPERWSSDAWSRGEKKEDSTPLTSPLGKMKTKPKAYGRRPKRRATM
ncbi:hypothetical protein LJC24_01515 [Desulfococcaceae bacterium OttesenSCG-928-F15]|nr:hypothetical protein [Desulfococcaceae bacterium OttesenSCG-928-F15]